MPKFEVDWTIRGRAVLEADDADEVDTILHDCLPNFDTTLFDEVIVEEVVTGDVVDA